MKEPFAARLPRGRPIASAEYRYELARHLVERGLVLAVERADQFALACFQTDILHDLGDI